ncbi:hypothetical protein ACJJTC_007043 [Scirpophaga incertulas]
MEDLKTINVNRGYVKGIVTRIHNFVSDSVELESSTIASLEAKREKLITSFMSILTRKLDSYSIRAYQLDRDQNQVPTINEFLDYLSKRALALEKCKYPTRASWHGRDFMRQANLRRRVALATVKTALECLYFVLFSKGTGNNILIPTARVKLYGRNGVEVHVKCVLDSASQVSLITTKAN